MKKCVVSVAQGQSANKKIVQDLNFHLLRRLFFVFGRFALFADEQLTNVGRFVKRLAVDRLLRLDDGRKVDLMKAKMKNFRSD